MWGMGLLNGRIEVKLPRKRFIARAKWNLLTQIRNLRCVNEICKT